MPNETNETVEAKTYYKITHGYVIQRFNNRGECLSQEFKAGCDDDDVEYLYDNYEINIEDMPLKGDEYHPFDMVQP